MFMVHSKPQLGDWNTGFVTHCDKVYKICYLKLWTSKDKISVVNGVEGFYIDVYEIYRYLHGHRTMLV